MTKDEDGNWRKQEFHHRSVICHKYIGLSQIMRDHIQLMHMMLEVSNIFGMKCDLCNSYTTNFEDNKGAVELEKEPKYRPRTRHFSIKLYHFREHIK